MKNEGAPGAPSAGENSGRARAVSCPCDAGAGPLLLVLPMVSLDSAQVGCLVLLAALLAILYRGLRGDDE